MPKKSTGAPGNARGAFSDPSSPPVTAGIVYLLHFDAPGPGGARHYIGWTHDLDARLARHAAGDGAKLLREIVRQGIGFVVVRQWEGQDRAFERRLKKRRNHARHCPLCRGAALQRHKEEERRRRSKIKTAATADELPY